MKSAPANDNYRSQIEMSYQQAASAFGWQPTCGDYYKMTPTTTSVTFADPSQSVRSIKKLSPGASYKSENVCNIDYDDRLFAGDPEANLSKEARRQFNLLSETVQIQVLNACRLHDFGYARRALQVTELFTHSGWIHV